MKDFLLLLSLILIFGCSYGQLDAGLIEALQSDLNQAVENEGNNGVSAYLIASNGELWSGTAGVNGSNDPITESTVFHGASTTKFNLALLFMLLKEDNAVNLDDSWTEYISLNVPIDEAITLRQLLNHSSGIADYLETTGTNELILSDFGAVYSPEYILEELVNPAPLFSPGEGFQYSNSNYVLLGLIAESITGTPVHEELRNRIWDPLEMENTYFGGYESYTEQTAGVWWNFGNGVTNYSSESTSAMLTLAYGAGNIVSTPKDLALLMDAVIHFDVITESSWNEMLEFVPQSFSSWTNGYGLGTHHLNASNDDTLLGHDGYFTNMTDMFYSTEYGFTLVTMTNTQTSWTALYNSLYNILENYSLSSQITSASISEKVLVYPNPASQLITIKSPTPILSYSMADMYGKEVKVRLNQNSQINIEKLTPGIYILKVRTVLGVAIRKLEITS